MIKLGNNGNKEDQLIKEYNEVVTSLPTSSPIFLPTDKISLEDRLAGVKKVRDLYQFRLESFYRSRLVSLREKYKGQKRCFIIGNGPSLNLTDLSMLKNEVTFAVNGFFLKVADLDWLPTFYVVEDHLVAEDRMKWINEFKGPTKLFPAYLSYCLEEGPDTIFFNHQPRVSYPDGFDFSIDASKITYTGCTVTFTCIQLAFYLGFKEIYLIGVDASYEIPKDAQQGDSYAVGILDMKSDDPNHFHPDYFGKGFRWHDPQVNKMVEAYTEARRIVDQTEQRIYNATVGGKLEVFKRVPYREIFPNAKTYEESEHRPKQNDDHSISDKGACINENHNSQKGDTTDLTTSLTKTPKILLLDTTPIGNGTATGEIKKNLFNDYPADKIFQIFSTGKDKIGIGSGGTYQNFIPDKIITEQVDKFNPEIIVYRPVPDNIKLHRTALSLINKLRRPLIIWIMDDWPNSLANSNPALFEKMDRDLRDLFARAQTRLSIGDAMSNAFEQRYGYSFLPLANGVLPENWPQRTHENEDGKPVLVRYAGALAENMTLTSMVRVAHAVEKLAQELPIKLEIRTSQHWLHAAGPQFANLQHTQFEPQLLPREEYQAWLQQADIVVIAYNFDQKSKDYIRYSIANKMPECLASGAALLAHGPIEVATIDYLKSEKCAAIVASENKEAIVEQLRELATTPELRNQLAQKARAVAFENHNIINLRKKLISIIMQTADTHNNPEYLVGHVYRRDQNAHLDETELVFHLFESHDNRTMIDVGAHHGWSAAPFADQGWRVFCFEPDPSNHQKLVARLGRKSNVTIDSHAVSDKPEHGKALYSSDESTGISGMLVFRDSHKQIATVDVTTVTEIVKDNGITHIDFLKIDVEGYDFSVLKGVPWDDIQPDIIECEFEDEKTKLLGHSWQDICEFLVEKGYTVYVSEWHPIVRYGIRHDWHALKKYPCELADDKAWGNLLAFKRAPEKAVLEEALNKTLKVDNPRTTLLFPEQTGSVNSSRDFSSVSDRANSTKHVQRAGFTAHKKHKSLVSTLMSLFSAPPQTPLYKDPSLTRYARFAHWLRDNIPPLFLLGQFGVWCLRKMKPRPAQSVLSILLLIGLATSPWLVGALAPYALAIWLVETTFIAVVSGILIKKFVNEKKPAFGKVAREIETVRAENVQLKKDQETIRAEIEKIRANLLDLSKSIPAFNFSDYQNFNRKLTSDHIGTLTKEWSRKLGYQMTQRSLSYLAHRICMMESGMRGRLATTVEDAVLRTIVAASVKHPELRVLEIGTLFGIGLAMIYDHCRNRYRRVHLTAIDPLDGYYSRNARDIVTDETIDETNLRLNMKRADIPESDFTLIKALSTDDQAIDAARAGGEYDLLIIDGDHSYAGVKVDFVQYLPMVARGGYIIFDDYGAADWPGVKEFVDEYVIPHPNVVLVGTSWRTAVFRVIQSGNDIKTEQA